MECKKVGNSVLTAPFYFLDLCFTGFARQLTQLSDRCYEQIPALVRLTNGRPVASMLTTRS